jgi:ketosteroid isomerase-like protein
LNLYWKAFEMPLVQFLTVLLITLVTLFDGTASAIAQSGSAEQAVRIPRALVAALPEKAPAYAILVATDKQQLSVYRFDGHWRPVMTVRCSTGKNAGPKQKNGDSKTPHGVYFLTRVFHDKDLSAVYGTMALTTEYPNMLDRVEGRNGHSIWIHGTNKPLKDRDSNGCIVLENRHIQRLAPLVELRRTPVIIEKRIRFDTLQAGDDIRRRVERLVDEWRNGFENGSYHDYLAGYHASYLPDIGWWNAWRHLRSAAEGKSHALSFTTGRPCIYRSGSLLTVVLEQYLQSGQKRTAAGTRKFFLREEEGHLSVVGEEYLIRPLGVGDGEPLVATARKLLEWQDPETAVQRRVDRWLAAWSAKDLAAYGACYADDFRSPDGSRLADWLAHKKKLNRRYRFIKVTGENFTIDVKRDTAIVTFLQRYVSSGYRARGKKRLTLKNEDGKWKIYRETWAGK